MQKQMHVLLRHSADDLSDVGPPVQQSRSVDGMVPPTPWHAVGIANYLKGFIIRHSHGQFRYKLCTGTFATQTVFQVAGVFDTIILMAQIVQETNGAANIGVFRAFNGEAMTYTTPIAQYTSMTADFVSVYYPDDLSPTATIGGVPNTSLQQ